MTPGRTLILFRQVYDRERAIAFVGTPLGKLVLWFVATVLLLPHYRAVSIVVPPLLALVLCVPAQRNIILSFGAVWIFFKKVAGGDFSHVRGLGGGELSSLLVVAVAAGGFSYLCYLAAKFYPRLPVAIQRNSQVSLHLLVWIPLAISWFVPRSSGSAAATLWLLVPVLPFLLWRCGYVLLAGRRGRAGSSRFSDHFFYLYPVYGGTDVPHGKGYDYLSQTRARSDESWARAQVAGLKLLVLASLWKAMKVALGGAVYGDPGNPVTVLFRGHTLALPRLSDLIGSPHLPHVSPVIPWVAIFLDLITVTLERAVEGHVIIGCLRLFGFYVFRNTYKPLLAQSIVEFWNRLYYYFKELLVEFFFLPTYLAHFRNRPKLRLLAATVAAALFGNVYYHVLRDWPMLAQAGARGAWALVGPRAFYSLLLAAGIYVSMLREQKRRGTTQTTGAALARLRAIQRIAGVWTFYAIIHIWNVYPVSMTFAQRTRFFFSLFGHR